jgi:hypothetical protein
MYYFRSKSLHLMKKLFASLAVIMLFVCSSCVTPVSAGGTTASGDRTGNARNWVIIMHGESCGNAEDVASNMYVENNHDTQTITVTVDISWTENSQPKHENKTISVGPNSKQLIECDYRNGVYLKMEIVNAVFS